MSETQPEEPVVFEPVPEAPVQVETQPEAPVVFEPVPEEQTTPIVDIITLEDIQNEQIVLLQSETDFKNFLTQNILNVSLASIRPRLIQWATLQYPYGYTLISVPITLPHICSDGIARSASDYIEFCLGTPISEVISTLSKRITGVILTCRVSPTLFEIIVIKT
jgi:hypothetical protein